MFPFNLFFVFQELQLTLHGTSIFDAIRNSSSSGRLWLDLFDACASRESRFHFSTFTISRVAEICQETPKVFSRYTIDDFIRNAAPTQWCLLFLRALVWCNNLFPRKQLSFFRILMLVKNLLLFVITFYVLTNTVNDLVADAIWLGERYQDKMLRTQSRYCMHAH